MQVAAAKKVDLKNQLLAMNEKRNELEKEIKLHQEILSTVSYQSWIMMSETENERWVIYLNGFYRLFFSCSKELEWVNH